MLQTQLGIQFRQQMIHQLKVDEPNSKTITCCISNVTGAINSLQDKEMVSGFLLRGSVNLLPEHVVRVGNV